MSSTCGDDRGDSFTASGRTRNERSVRYATRDHRCVRPSGVPASEGKSLRADSLAAVAVGLWRTATKKPDGLPEGSRCIYIGYEVAE